MHKNTTAKRPVVGVIACRKQIGPLWSHAVAEKYLIALDRVANVMPILIPSVYDLLNTEELFDRIDGLLLPGSVSNIEPHNYNDFPVDDSDARDSHRDNTALKIIRDAIKYNTPVLGICRGFQEINVALGGALHQRVANEYDLMDHRAPENKELFEQFEIAHEINLVKGGLLNKAVGKEKITVNSLHIQGIKKLGKNLKIEATASDGLIEAFRLDEKNKWMLGVQWHPEWQTEKSSSYTAIFQSFGRACWKNRPMNSFS